MTLQGQAPESSAGHRRGAGVLLGVHKARDRRHHHGRRRIDPSALWHVGVLVPDPAPPSAADPLVHSACSTSCN